MGVSWFGFRARNKEGVCLRNVRLRSKQRQPAKAKNSLIWEIAQEQQSLRIATAVVPMGLGIKVRKGIALAEETIRASFSADSRYRSPAQPEEGSIVYVQNLLVKVVLHQQMVFVLTIHAERKRRRQPKGQKSVEQNKRSKMATYLAQETFRNTMQLIFRRKKKMQFICQF